MNSNFMEFITSADINNSNQKKIRLTLTILVLISLANYILNALLPALQFRGVDFQAYYDFACMPDPRIADQPIPWFLYFPIWGVFFKPFSWFSYGIAKNIWVILNTLMAGGFIWGGGYLLNEKNSLPLSRIYTWSFLAVLVLNYPPLWVTLKNGQINLLVLICLGASFGAWKKGYPLWAGFFLALAISTRYTPGIFLLYWVIKKEYKLCLSTLGTLGVLFILSIIVLGWKVHLDYWILFKHYAAYTQVHYNLYGNITLYSLLSNLKGDVYLPGFISPMAGQVSFSIVLLGTAIMLSLRQARMKAVPTLLEYGLWATILPLISYFGENHHYTFALLGFMGAWEVLTQKEFRSALGLLLTGWLGTGLVFHAQNMGITRFCTQYFNYLDGLFILGSSLVLCYLTYRFRSPIKEDSLS